MAPEKCCYTIFSKTANSKFRFDLKFYDKCIPYSQENKFLGVVFDESLCFTKNTDTLIKKSRSRLNIVKILSHKSWHLSERVLLSIYKCLVRSIFDYHFFNTNSLSENNLKKIQTIQNCALMSIYKNWERGGQMNLLHQLAKLPRMQERMFNLGNNYFKKSINYKNPLIVALIKEFNEMISQYKNKSFICHGPLSYFDIQSVGIT